MTLTPRRRVAAALVLASFLGYLYFWWAFALGENILRQTWNGYSDCSSTVVGSVGTCVSSGTGVIFGWVKLVIVSMLGLIIAWLLARWTLRPLRDVGQTVSQLGPTSLGLRINATGPRDETRQLSEAIDAMLDRVAHGYEAQRRFASNASHELRTPLATQRALIEISLTSALEPAQLDLVSRQLLATNERNERLIESLLALAETDRGLLSRAPQRLDEIAAVAVAAMRPLAEAQAVQLVTELAPAEVSGEQPLLERLLMNLVHNAIKYNGPAGWVRVKTAEAQLEVSNSGPLVPSEQVAGLFEPFRRLSGERLEHGGGVGLGLTIARSIVSAHGGSISAVANATGGLTVTVRLPGVR